MLAFGGTAVIFAGMATLAGTVKSDLSGMGKWLFVGMMVVLVASVANIWLQMPALMLAVSALACGIFSAYILYDVKRIMDGGETNYVIATLSIYLDVYNVFVSLLQLLMALGGAGDD
jgi:modulator of FtsH protease